MHMTTAFEPGTVQLLHIFRPELLADPGGRIEKAAVEPLVGERRVDVLAWYPDRPEDRQFLDLIASSFSLGGTTAEGAPAVACAAGLAEADAEPRVCHGEQVRGGVSRAFGLDSLGLSRTLAGIG